uniref:WD_REPEATS_REGION domain-containing protein n=1 Tax=Macrostomum lignano TaxID=282301 RepID=A0A1I8F8N8_9PLAT
LVRVGVSRNGRGHAPHATQEAEKGGRGLQQVLGRADAVQGAVAVPARAGEQDVPDCVEFAAVRAVGCLDETHAALHLGRSRVVLDISSAYAGSFDPAKSQEAPDCQLQLEWVYGSRGSDCRNNLIYLESSGELVYFMAAVVVLHDVNGGTQRHYTEHTDDVHCIAVHPDRNTLATGQSSGHRKVQGQGAYPCLTLHVIGEQDFQRAVCCVAFSSYDKGELLCAVDEANDHHLSVWDWKAEKRLCQAKASKEPIMDVEFNPQEPNAIVSCGRGQISFWTIDDARNLEAKRGTFKQRDMWPVFPCFKQSMNGGTGRNKITRELSGAHSDAVFSLTFLRDGRLVSGGRAGRLVLWDDSCQRKLMDTEVPMAYGAVRCIVQGKGERLYLETIKNCVLEGSFSDGFSPIS